MSMKCPFMCLYGAYDDIMGLADVYGVTHKLFSQCTQALVSNE